VDLRCVKNIKIAWKCLILLQQELGATYTLLSASSIGVAAGLTVTLLTYSIAISVGYATPLLFHHFDIVYEVLVQPVVILPLPGM